MPVVIPAQVTCDIEGCTAKTFKRVRLLLKKDGTQVGGLFLEKDLQGWLFDHPVHGTLCPDHRKERKL